MYSLADKIQYIVNRVRLEDGRWEPDPECAEVEAYYNKAFQEQMGKTIGYVGVELESRDSIIRCEETNFGNMICDLMRTEYFTDFSICISGAFRKNAVIEQGPISLLNIQESFPFNDPTMVLRMNG